MRNEFYVLGVMDGRETNAFICLGDGVMYANSEGSSKVD
jgi:hypothetical protein